MILEKGNSKELMTIDLLVFAFRKELMTIDLLDIENVYDKFEWDFIRKSFTDLGFSDRWTKSLMQRVTIPSFRVIIDCRTIYTSQLRGVLDKMIYCLRMSSLFLHNILVVIFIFYPCRGSLVYVLN